MWEHGYKKQGTSFEELEEKFAHYIRKCHPKRVVLTRFEDYQISYDDYPNLINLVDDIYDYAYGWEPDMFNSPDEYCEGGSHSTVVYVPEWIKKLSKKRVYLSGAFDGECIEDMEIALNHVRAKYTRVNSLII